MPSKRGSNTHNNKSVKPKECFAIALNILMRFLPIFTQGDLTEKDIHRYSIAMATQKLSFHSLGSIMTKVTSETNFWYHIAKLNMKDIELINHLLLSNPILDIIPRNMPLRFAIDETDDPYYGKKIPENDEYIIKSKRKKSTVYFYRYISLDILIKSRRITLAIFPVKKEVPKIEYIKRMLSIISKMGFTIDILLLDRGFYSAEIFSMLMLKQIPHIMPVKVHSEDMKQLLNGKRSRLAKYTMNKTKDPLELDIAIKVCYLMGKYGKHEVRNYGYFYYKLDWTPAKIASVYKKRFGIESSYSIRNKVRNRTSTRNPTIRYYYALVSMLLKNIWVMLRWKRYRLMKRGPPSIDEDVFRFDLFRLLVWSYAVKLLGALKAVKSIRPG